MGQFSDDGQWWWDGTTWMATAHIVLPQFPPTEFAQSGRVGAARGRLRKTGWLSWVNDAGCALSWLALIPFASVTVPALRDYRLWTLEQLAAATAYLLGPNEPMLAGEATVLPPQFVGDSEKRDLAVAVTAAHILLFSIDSFDGQPRSIVLVARPTDVTMEVRSFVRAGFLGGPALTVSSGNAQWVIRGESGVFKPKPVLDAWRTASAQRQFR
jgi:hypothetical protein